MMTFFEDVRARTGLDEEAATTAVRAAVELLAAALDERAREDLLAAIPDSLGTRVPRLSGQITLDDLAIRVAHELGLAPGHAIETTQVIGQALFARVSADTRARARTLLDPSLRDLLAPPPTREAPPAEGARRQTGAGRTLATGRAGSAHPLSEAHPPEGHGHPIARSAAPHADAVLSGAPGTELGRESLAEGRPGSGRPLSTGGRR
jgi:hypothetical protein